MQAFVRALAALVLALAVHPLAAQTKWPEKPVKLVVGFTAGSATDVTARMFGQKFGEAWGQPIVVENIAGNSGAIGTDRVAKAAADGYTLMWSGNAAITILPSLQPLPFDPLKDFAPISTALSMPSIFFVNNDLPVKSIACKMKQLRSGFMATGAHYGRRCGPELIGFGCSRSPCSPSVAGGGQ